MSITSCSHFFRDVKNWGRIPNLLEVIKEICLRRGGDPLVSPPEDPELYPCLVGMTCTEPSQDKMCFEEYKDFRLFGHSGTITVSDVAPKGPAPFLLPSCVQFYSPPRGMLWLNRSFGFVQSLCLRDWILKLQLTPLQGKRPCPWRLMRGSAVAQCFCTVSMFIHSFSTVLVTNFGSHELLYIAVSQTTWVGESSVVTSKFGNDWKLLWKELFKAGLTFQSSAWGHENISVLFFFHRLWGTSSLNSPTRRIPVASSVFF